MKQHRGKDMHAVGGAEPLPSGQVCLTYSTHP
jgi:hypothetical protein